MTDAEAELKLTDRQIAGYRRLLHSIRTGQLPPEDGRWEALPLNLSPNQKVPTEEESANG